MITSALINNVLVYFKFFDSHPECCTFVLCEFHTTPEVLKQFSRSSSSERVDGDVKGEVTTIKGIGKASCKLVVMLLVVR